MIQKKQKGLERMEVLIRFHVKVFLGNKYNRYIHTARNAKVTSRRTEEERFSEAYLELTRTST